MSDDVDIGIRLREEGAAIARQVARDVEALRKHLFELTTAARANAEAMRGQGNVHREILAAIQATSNAQRNATQATNAHALSLRSLAQAAISAAAAFVGFQGFKAFIGAGLEFNQTIEDANLGIASLITAQATLHDKNGQLLVGTKALGAAQELAADQVNKLRIAGLQTTATTQELVVAFQQAVGVGLKWGFTLDQSRKFTILMAQAAKTLQLPMNQLNEEIRDLLAGNINSRNTRIATALNITNAQIKQAQAAGNLFDFVSKRMEAFGIAGEATAKTFSGVMSNIKDSFQLVAGDATKPLFESLKAAGLSAMDEIFDMKNARISEKFSGIIEVAQRFFGVIGDMLADAIGAAVKGAEAFNEWMLENGNLVEDLWHTMGLIVDQFKGLVGDVARVVFGLAQAGTEAGVLNLTFRVIAVFIAGFRDGLKAVVGILGLIGGIVLEAILDPFRLLLLAIASVVQFVDKDMAASLRGTAKQVDEFLTETSHGIKDIWKDFASGNSATAKVIAQFDEVGKAADKATDKVKKNKKELATVTGNSTGKPEVKADPAKAAKSLVDSAKAELSRYERDLAASLARNEISYAEYYNNLTIAQQKFVDVQIESQKILRDNPKATAEAKAAASASIKQLEAERLQVMEDNAEKLRVAMEKLQDEVNKAQIQLLKDQGRFAEARALEVEGEFKKSQARLVKNAMTAGAQIVANLFDIDNAKARMAELERAAKIITDTLATRLDEINTQSTAHAISEREARDQIVAAYTKARAQLTAMLPEMAKFAALTQDPANVQAVEELRIKLEQMGVTIKQTGDELFKFKEGARDAFESGLAQFFDDAATGAKDIGESFRDMARSIIASLRQIAAQMLATLIIEKSLKLFGFSTGGAVPSVKKATGGYIYGPGSSTSDSIPAWLSAGEYVINARAVETVGRDFLDSVNAAGGSPSVAGRGRTRGYAEGGLIAETSNDPSIDNRLTVGLEDGLVLRHLETREGTAAQLRFIEKNANKIKRALGQG